MGFSRFCLEISHLQIPYDYSRPLLSEEVLFQEPSMAMENCGIADIQDEFRLSLEAFLSPQRLHYLKMTSGFWWKPEAACFLAQGIILKPAEVMGRCVQPLRASECLRKLAGAEFQLGLVPANQESPVTQIHSYQNYR